MAHGGAKRTVRAPIARRRRLARIGSAALACLAITLAAGEVQGQESVAPTLSGQGPRTINVGLEGSVATSGVSLGAAPAWILECRWGVSTQEALDTLYWGYLPHDPSPEPADDDAPDAPEDPDAEPEAPAEWGYLMCPVNATTMAINPYIEISGLVTYWPMDGDPPAELVGFVLERAFALLEVPATTGVSAPLGDDAAPMITQLPTWLWVEDAIWQPRSVSPEPVLGVQATATATPVSVSWSGGSDGPVDCGANTGAVYDFGRRAEDQNSDCTTAYWHSSAVEDTSIAATVTWAVTYSCNVACGPGSWGDLVVTTTRPVRVAELMAIGTISGASVRSEGTSS